jgi:hypothetical protein
LRDKKPAAGSPLPVFSWDFGKLTDRIRAFFAWRLGVWDANEAGRAAGASSLHMQGLNEEDRSDHQTI